MEHQHRAGGQLGTERLEEVSLRQGKRTEPQPGEDFVQLFLPNKVAGPLPEELVDGLIAHDNAVGLGILGQQGGLHRLLLPLGQQRHTRRIAATGCRRFHQKPVDEGPQGDGSLQPALAEFAAIPGNGHRILRSGGAAHLKKRRQHEKRQHRQNRHANKQGSLVFAENLKGADHGTACGCSRTVEPPRLDKELGGRVTLWRPADRPQIVALGRFAPIPMLASFTKTHPRRRPTRWPKRLQSDRPPSEPVPNRPHRPARRVISSW